MIFFCMIDSLSQISDTPQTGFEPAQNLNSGLVEWSCALVITTTPSLTWNIASLWSYYANWWQKFSNKLKYLIFIKKTTNGGMKFGLKWIKKSRNSVTDFRISYIRADVLQNDDFSKRLSLTGCYYRYHWCS